MTRPSALEPLSAFPIVTPVTLRFSDQDPLGHINNVAITALLESGRVGLIRHLFADFGLAPGATVLAHMELDFRREILFPGTVQVGARLTRIGTRSFSSSIAIFQDENCCVTSASTNVFFDKQNRCSKEPPEELRDHLETVLAAHEKLKI